MKLHEMATTRNPFLQSVYSIIRHIPGVQPIDGRSKHNIYFRSDIKTTEAVKAALVQAFGPPTEDHPMMSDIKWKNGANTINLPKAASMDGGGIVKQLSAW